MKQFEVKILIQGAAFSDGGTYALNTELSKILNTVSARVENGFTSGLIFDSNGNSCGSFGISKTDETERG